MPQKKVGGIYLHYLESITRLFGVFGVAYAETKGGKVYILLMNLHKYKFR